jgi:hypothetical protein
VVSPPSPLPPHLADVLSEPKAAALEALTRFLDGESAEDIASKRGEKKAIQRGTVLGYLGECIGGGLGCMWAVAPMMARQPLQLPTCHPCQAPLPLCIAALLLDVHRYYVHRYYVHRYYVHRYYVHRYYVHRYYVQISRLINHKYRAHACCGVVLATRAKA